MILIWLLLCCIFIWILNSTVEFMHYIMASKSLKKVFISIKGIYYQAEIMNQTITWVVPHKRGYKVCIMHVGNCKNYRKMFDKNEIFIEYLL